MCNIYGAAKHNRVEITPRNLFGRAHCYYMYSDELVEGRTSLTDILTRMFRSGKYVPSPTWVIPYQGSGMDFTRAQAIWKMTLTPDQTTPDDVHHVFFRAPQRYTDAYVAECLDVAATRASEPRAYPKPDKPRRSYNPYDTPSARRADQQWHQDQAQSDAVRIMASPINTSAVQLRTSAPAIPDAPDDEDVTLFEVTEERASQHAAEVPEVLPFP
ncbi:hypothetical protein WJX74_010832 [Apatococcus lobatus]|uniref:Replitron C-terminal domain-containing protein n=1 Tax=Apatococcus lobatus TaxID=904363 RepID=A0AAW1RE40_9CHLO